MEDGGEKERSALDEVEFQIRLSRVPSRLVPKFLRQMIGDLAARATL